MATPVKMDFRLVYKILVEVSIQLMIIFSTLRVLIYIFMEMSVDDFRWLGL